MAETCHANVEARNKAGMTPMYWAAFHGDLELAKYLYETCHAKITQKIIDLINSRLHEDEDGMMPTHNVIDRELHENNEVVRYLQSKLAEQKR